MHPGFLTCSPDSVFKPSFPAVRVINDHSRLLPGQGTEKQRLLQAVKAAALVQSPLVHRGIGSRLSTITEQVFAVRHRQFSISKRFPTVQCLQPETVAHQTISDLMPHLRVHCPEIRSGRR